MTRRMLPLILLIPVFVATLAAQESFDIREHYTKREYAIPARDGIKLHTAVYTPKDTSKTYPIIMTRTPYAAAPYGEQRIPQSFGYQFNRFAKDGYILVFQDVRGRYMSEGEFENVRPYNPKKSSTRDIDETSDTYDTIEWLLENTRHHNGNVGVLGTSYPGFYTWMSTISAHPAVKATSPQAPVSQWMSGDDFFHNGAFMLPHAFDFYSWFGWPRPKPKKEADRFLDQGTPDEYDFFLRLGALPNANKLYLHDSVAFWNTLMANGQWNDFWAQRSILPHLRGLKPAVLVVGGWFDTENLYGALNSYSAAERQSQGSDIRLVMGPWSHGQWGYDSGDSLGRIQWNSPTAHYYVDSIEAPFFAHHLKGAQAPKIAEATVFNTGDKTWSHLPAWPPSGTSEYRLYLEEGNGLSSTPPSSANPHDEYISDPNRPVPYTNEITGWYYPPFMLEDQRFASRRPDVLVYTTEPMAEELTIAGPITVDLTVSTTGTDCDWIVKVIDVYPDRLGNEVPAGWFQGPTKSLGGYQMMGRGDVLRGKFRNGLERPEPFIPDTPAKVHFTLQDAFHTFRKGHRIMIQVQSTWFPMIDRNPGKFMDIYRAADSDFQKTTQRVYRSSTASSSVIFRRLPQPTRQ